MLQASKEFEQAIFAVLSSIHSAPKNFEAWQCDLSDIDLHDVLQHLINLNYLLGVSLQLGSGGDLMVFLGSPRLSYEGLKFIESHFGYLEARVRHIVIAH